MTAGVCVEWKQHTVKCVVEHTENYCTII